MSVLQILITRKIKLLWTRGNLADADYNMIRGISLVFRTLTLLVPDINVTFLNVEKNVFRRNSLKIYVTFLSFLIILMCYFSKINRLRDRI